MNLADKVALVTGAGSGIGRSVALKFAAIFGPGLLCSVAANCTSTLGMRYVPSSLTCVWKFCSTWQYGLSSALSGTWALISQLSLVN